jgi:hypothetical protein
MVKQIGNMQKVYCKTNQWLIREAVILPTCYLSVKCTMLFTLPTKYEQFNI